MSALKVSVVIPCRNEEKYIARCLDSILNGDYPVAQLEILVVDGMSDDKTRSIVGEFVSRHPQVRLLENPKQTAPAALNVGLRAALGKIIVRLDAHTTYSPDYIARSVYHLEQGQAANVGGVIKTRPGGDGLMAQAIALSISHFFGVGLSHFRIGVAQSRYVDTVPFGCFYKSLIDQIGYFDENQPRNEDIDFNQRILATGQKILLVPEIVSYYYARGTLKDFLKHNFDNGRLVTERLHFHEMIHSLRHLVPLVAIIGMMVMLSLAFAFPRVWLLIESLLALYLIASLYFSFKTSLRQKNFAFMLLMPFAFGCLHISYGLGSLFGLCKAIWIKITKPITHVNAY